MADRTPPHVAPSSVAPSSVAPSSVAPSDSAVPDASSSLGCSPDLLRGPVTRRRFLKTASIAAAAAPAILTAKRTEAQQVIGEGDHRYRYQHQWPQLPAPYSWQTTHNVAFDPQEGLLYVIHEGRVELTDHPSIFVFDAEGHLVRAFGQQFQGGGHGLEVRREGSETFLYVAAYQQAKTIAKLTPSGELVWQQYAPMASGHYAPGEASDPRQVWGRDRFLPTNFAFLPDGGFLLADGYGAFYIHRYDAQGQWQSCFGGPGDGKGTFQTPHGLWIDSRGGRTPEIVVADRAHNTLQTFDLDGQYRATIEGFGLPANIDTHGELMLVPELVARVSLLGPDNQTLLTLGDDRQRILDDKQKTKGFTIRTDPQRWQDGKFVHPHDACFDAEGNIFVAEWVHTGRVTRLERV